MTWVVPVETISNQIYHITITRKYRGCLKNGRTMRGADVASDHILLRAKFHIKLEITTTRSQNEQKRRKFNVLWLMKSET